MENQPLPPDSNSEQPASSGGGGAAAASGIGGLVLLLFLVRGGLRIANEVNKQPPRENQVQRVIENEAAAAQRMQAAVELEKSVQRQASFKQLQSYAQEHQVSDEELTALLKDHWKERYQTERIAAPWQIIFGGSEWDWRCYVDWDEPVVRQLIASHPLKNAERHLRSGEYEQAIASYKAILERQPNSSRVHNALGWLFATSPSAQHRHGEQALEHATKACELTEWKDAIYLDTLAAAHAERGEFEKAIECQTQAIELSSEAVLAELKEHLASFQAGQAVREDPTAAPKKPVPAASLALAQQAIREVPAASAGAESSSTTGDSSRCLFKYAVGSFKQGGGKSWQETRDTGVISNFIEISRTESYVELYDEERDLKVRLYHDVGKWHSKETGDWYPWPGSEGSWQPTR